MGGTTKIKSHFLKSVLLQWETMIFVTFIIINIININLSSNYPNFNNVMSNMVVLMDKVLMVFTAMMVLLLREINISIVSIICLLECCTGVTFEAGLPIVPTMIAGLLAETACGFFSGILLVTFPDLNPIIVTLGNQILLRGIAYIVLEDKPITSVSSKTSFLTWSKVAGILSILIVPLIEALVSAFVIHRTKFGRSPYVIGSNAKASRFPGIKTSWIKVLMFTFSGLCAGFVGLFLVSKLENTRASIVEGYEMEVIAMVILDGVSTAGGRGKVLSAVLRVFSIEFLRYGPGIVNISSQILMIITRALLVVAVVIPNLKEMVSEPASGGWIRLCVTHSKQK